MAATLPLRRHRCGGNRLAEHPPACANVCVAASARPLANTRVGAFDATRQSSVAQLAEQPAVNRQVTGSSPVGGATEEDPSGVLFHVRGNRAVHAEVLMVMRCRPSEA